MRKRDRIERQNQEFLSNSKIRRMEKEAKERFVLGFIKQSGNWIVFMNVRGWPGLKRRRQNVQRNRRNERDESWMRLLKRSPTMVSQVRRRFLQKVRKRTNQNEIFNSECWRYAWSFIGTDTTENCLAQFTEVKSKFSSNASIPSKLPLLDSIWFNFLFLSLFSLHLYFLPRKITTQTVTGLDTAKTQNAIPSMTVQAV